MMFRLRVRYDSTIERTDTHVIAIMTAYVPLPCNIDLQNSNGLWGEGFDIFCTG